MINSIAPGNSDAHTKVKAAASPRYYHLSWTAIQTRKISHLHQNPDHAGSQVVHSKKSKLQENGRVSPAVLLNYT